MGIIVKHVKTNRLIFYVKGADSIMLEKVKQIHQGFIEEEAEALASKGFRTLVIAQKLIT